MSHVLPRCWIRLFGSHTGGWLVHQIVQDDNVRYCVLLHHKERVHSCQARSGGLLDRSAQKDVHPQTSFLGTYGQIASWTGQIVADVFPDYNRCYKKHLSLMTADPYLPVKLDACARSIQCDLCCRLVAVEKIKPPEKYPKERQANLSPVSANQTMNARHIIFLRQTHKFLKQAVFLTKSNVQIGCWSEGTMTAYLRSCAVSKSVIENVWRVRKKW